MAFSFSLFFFFSFKLHTFTNSSGPGRGIEKIQAGITVSSVTWHCFNEYKHVFTICEYICAIYWNITITEKNIIGENVINRNFALVKHPKNDLKKNFF